MKKKCFVFLIIVAMAAFLFGCGKKTTSNAELVENKTTEASKDNEEILVIDVQEDNEQADSQENAQLDAQDSEQTDSQDNGYEEFGEDEQDDSFENDKDEGDSLKTKTEWYKGVGRDAQSWEILIEYLPDCTLVTIDHNKQIYATYDAGGRPTGEGQDVTVYDLGAGPEPVMGSENVQIMIEWSGDNLLLYKNDLSHYVPTDENPWELEGLEFEKYKEEFN